MNNKLNIFVILVFLAFGFGSFSYAQPSRSLWSLKSSFLYLNMKMNDYNNFAKHYNSMVGKEAMKPLNNGFGGIIELRRPLFRKFYAGIETGIITGGVESRGVVFSAASNTNTTYYHKLSLTSVPINVNFYYSFIRNERLNIYSGFSPGLWLNRIVFLDTYDYQDREGEGFIYGKPILSSQNLSYCLQLGSEYHIFGRIGIDIKLSYRSANFKGFSGEEHSRFIYVNKVRNTSRFDKNRGKVILTYDPGSNRLSTPQENSDRINEAHINMGNWGGELGLVWFF